ncbi:hypothetical protein EUTSA_v10025406mg [Eutrema salsugineum]|uniref:F-box domain-containing protein n=1 Tax=Eutrema salsugineum TaxID=72664 RepID=V4MHN8_EUTSA|nr:hypothetical protein EUTSA_v10025406mg [Eutrema salsugineum]
MKTRRKRNVSGDPVTTTTRRNTRSRKSEEDGRESSSSLPIPIELFVDIFSRLPLKSIATCRCVSKLWSSIFRRPDFTELFLTKSSARPQILFAGTSDGELFFSSSSPPKVPVSNSSPLVPNHLARFNFDSFCAIRGIVRSLVCVQHLRILDGQKEVVVVICNPSTGQSLTSPKLKTSRIGVRSYFGYDPIGKQYKVLSMTQPSVNGFAMEGEEHQVLTLGGAGNLSWRMIECCIPTFCFDIRSEKFSFIKETVENAVDGTMINCNGKLGLIMSKDKKGWFSSGAERRSKRFVLWVLENLEEQEWSEHIYVLPAVWERIVRDEEELLCFAGVSQANEIVLLSTEGFYDHRPYLLYFSLERNTLVRVDIQETGVLHYERHRPYIDHVEDVKLYAGV